MFRKGWFTLFLLIGMVVSASCGSRQISSTPAANMPNPASVHCEQNSGRLELRQDASGGMSGICVFPDGSECDEWSYFRGECQPGSAPATPKAKASPKPTEPAPTEAAEIASDGWKVYHNEELGYNFHYPADATIITNDEPLKSFSIIGPVVGSDNWPQFTISHPADREDYRPPEGADLAKWLTDHHLLGDNRQPDVQITGTTAIHTRHERSPQSYAFDRFFFARSGQLYMIVIGHAGDKEDWDLYYHFLESIQFAK